MPAIPNNPAIIEEPFAGHGVETGEGCGGLVVGENEVEVGEGKRRAMRSIEVGFPGAMAVLEPQLVFCAIWIASGTGFEE